MSLESDSDLQEYLNQLMKKANEFKHDQSSSDGISPPSNLSLVSEESIPKETSSKPKSISNKSGVKNAAKNKLSAIEQKYSKNGRQPKDEPLSVQRKQSLANLSSRQFDVSSIESEAGSRSRPESRSDKYRTESSKVSTVRTDEILNLNNVLSFNDLVNMADIKEPKKDDSKVLAVEGVASNPEKGDPPERDTSISSSLGRRSLLDHDEEEHRDIFHASQKTELQRQSSTSSLLLPREGVFYSTSADRTRRKNSVLVFKDEVVWARVSNEGSNNVTTDSRTSQAESIEEDIASPVVKPKVKKDSKESLLNFVPEKRNKDLSKPHKLNEGENDKGREGSPVKESDKAVKSSIKHKTNTKSSSRRSLEKKPIDPSRGRLYHKRSSMSHKSHSSPSSHSSSSEKSENIDHTTSSSSSSEVMVQEKSRSRRYKSMISSSSSSSSSSLSLKCRRKHSSRHKKKPKLKLKNEHLLVELITKTMIKVLPKLHPNLYHENVKYSYPGSTMLVNPGFSYMPMELKASNIATSNADTYIPTSITTARIDDALKQTVAITREFLEAHQMLYNAYLKVLSTDSKYASVAKIEEIVRKGSKLQTQNNPCEFKNEFKKERRKKRS